MKKLSLFWQLLPFYALLVGAISIAFWTQYSHTLQVKHASAAAAVTVQGATTQNILQGKPVRILIPALSIDLPIVDGVYDTTNNVWSVSGTSANYATNTPLINNKGSRTVIYGHAVTDILGKLPNIKKGDIAYIYTDNGHIFQYKYTSSEVVAPQDTSVFTHLKGSPGIYVMTCDGLWSSERRIALFNLENSK
jgi:LPXTG-site transpeptidase (sortase) family protein